MESINIKESRASEKDISTFARYIDHTALLADTTQQTVEKLCKEAQDYGFASVCINPAHVKYAAKLLKGSSVKVCTVIGFPLGANTSSVKAFETTDAIINGAQEVDMVINIGAVKDGNYELVESDIKAVAEAAKKKALVKVIIETCLLTDEEKVKVCIICKKIGVEFVKTSTGFSKEGAKSSDVTLMKKTVGEAIEVKASAGIRTLDTMLEMIEAGAARIGTSSGISILSSKK